jgi:A/G-specific adenine glycosylase
MISKNNRAFFTRELMLWNTYHNDRSMPWKGEKDPYRIWLSEIILQQTRVEQGWDYYNKFIQKFPTISHLAKASDDTIFKMWEGLGYYSRCKNLIATARVIHEELQGRFPNTYQQIIGLKGVGSYTASAIASFAFNLPHAVVDGNVNRVLSRFFGIETPIDTTKGKALFAELAQQLLPLESPGPYNQALMDFGATICKPQLPLCATCVLQTQCIAFKTSRQQELPVKEKKLLKKSRWFYYLVMENKGQVLIHKRIAKDIWQNLHEFYLLEAAEAWDKAEILSQLAQYQLSLRHPEDISKPYKQQLTHQTIHAVFILVETPPQIPPGMQPVSFAAIKKLAFPRLINSYLEDKKWK